MKLTAVKRTMTICAALALTGVLAACGSSGTQSDATAETPGTSSTPTATTTEGTPAYPESLSTPEQAELNAQRAELSKKMIQQVDATLASLKDMRDQLGKIKTGEQYLGDFDQLIKEGEELRGRINENMDQDQFMKATQDLLTWGQHVTDLGKQLRPDKPAATK